MDKIINAVASKIVNHFACNNYISKENEEVYQYSLVVVLQSVLTIITMLIIGALFGRFLENICFLIILKLLRNFSGGLHSSKFSVCYLISISTNIVVLVCLHFMEISENYLVMVFLEIISVLVIIMFAPVQNENKITTPKECKLYKLVAIILSVMFFLVSIILLIIASNFACVIGLTMVLNAVFVLAEEIITGLTENIEP